MQHVDRSGAADEPDVLAGHAHREAVDAGLELGVAELGAEPVGHLRRVEHAGRVLGPDVVVGRGEPCSGRAVEDVHPARTPLPRDLLPRGADSEIALRTLAEVPGQEREAERGGGLRGTRNAVGLLAPDLVAGAREAARVAVEDLGDASGARTAGRLAGPAPRQARRA